MKKLPATYLRGLAKALTRKADHYTDEEKLVMLSGAAMNWLGDFVTDENIQWEKKAIPIDSLYLTGTNPAWNKVIIDECKRSPINLRAYIANHKKEARSLFSAAKFSAVPILVRQDEGHRKVLDGMGRVVASIRSGKKSVVAYIASPVGVPRPACEPHVVYDLIRAYQRGSNKDKRGLIAALRFLRKSYANVDNLLRERFNARWLPDSKLQSIIQKVLE